MKVVRPSVGIAEEVVPASLGGSEVPSGQLFLPNDIRPPAPNGRKPQGSWEFTAPLCDANQSLELIVEAFSDHG